MYNLPTLFPQQLQAQKIVQQVQNLSGLFCVLSCRYLAQQYINQPLLINGRKFGIRLWVLVPGAEPLRVYLHRNGLALFSEARYQPAGVCCVVVKTYNLNRLECLSFEGTQYAAGRFVDICGCRVFCAVCCVLYS